MKEIKQSHKELNTKINMIQKERILTKKQYPYRSDQQQQTNITMMNKKIGGKKKNLQTASSKPQISLISYSRKRDV